jgi:hypothetical protein
VVASGHLANEIGGPKSAAGSADLAFDQEIMRLMGAGDVQGVLRTATWERMLQAGNVTPAFLNYVLLLGLAGAPPTSTGLRFNEVSASVHHFEWTWS